MAVSPRFSDYKSAEATRYFDKLIVRITPSGGEACLIRDDKIIRNVELDSTNIDHEVTNLLSLIRLPNECKA